MITEDDPATNPLGDWDSVERCTMGFDADHLPEGANPADNFKDFVLGTYDGTPKTPEWAYPICGVEPSKTREIAKVLGKENKTAFTTAWGPGRTHNSESLQQLLMIVGALGGHFGQPAHFMGSWVRSRPFNNTKSIIRGTVRPYPYIPNEVDDILPDPVQWKAMLDKKYVWSGWEYTDFQPAEERNIDIKMIYNYSLNVMDRTEYHMGAIEAYRRMEFAVSHALNFNVNAQYSDIVLPIITPWETYPSYKSTDNSEYITVGGGVIDPLYECKTPQWIGEQLLTRWGIDPKVAYPKTQGQTFYEVLTGLEVLKDDGATYEKLLSFSPEEIAQFDAVGEPQEGRISYSEIRKNGVFCVGRKNGDAYGVIGLKGFREDPGNNKLNTASGKMEFYCENISKMADMMGFAKLSPLPEYVPPIGGYEETYENADIEGKKGKYPFQIFNPHYIRTAHAHFDNVPILREAFTRPVFMNELDAAEYGLVDGDTVRIYNEWGSIVRPLSTTKRMMRGVLGVTHGGWFELDEDGNDLGGSGNTLCAPTMTATRVSGYNTQIGAIEKYSKTFVPDAERLNKAPACQE
jgi:anaerobic dimethyl sulfoxide reductase subunit A